MQRVVQWIALTASFLPALAQDRLEIPYVQFTLSNGLNVILHEDHSTPMVAVNLWYHVGSANETKNRTGFAHLFEHLMFEGSKNVKEGDFDNFLESVGGNNNGSTNNDRTNYYESLPRHAVELALFLESDRMGFLLDSMSESRVNGQRDVVKNERRETYENQPYGMAWQLIPENLYPADHPYHWPTIGYMDDLTAASYDDVVNFFKKYYVPNNASLVIAGDIEPTTVRKQVEKWFSEIPAGKAVNRPTAVFAPLEKESFLTYEDQVQLPQVYLCYLTPARFTPGDAEMDMMSTILAGGKNSRLYKKLVYDLQVAQNVTASQMSQSLSSMFIITATARPGHTLDELRNLIDEEIAKLKTQAVAERELQRGVHQFEAQFLSNLQYIESKANTLNTYFVYAGNPDWVNEDLARYKALSPDDLSAAARRYLNSNGRFVLSIVPKGRTELAIPAEKE